MVRPEDAKRRFDEERNVTSVITSATTTLSVLACRKGGRAYVRVQSFKKSPDGKWEEGRQEVILPASEIDAVCAALKSAAAVAEGTRPLWSSVG